jgi:hypothetical protein
MGEQLFAVGSALVVLSAVLALACVVAQAMLARWWETPAGRHVFAFQAALAAVLTLWALRVWIPDSTFVVTLRSLAFALVPVVLGWRLLIILRTWRSRRRDHKRGEAHERAN